MIFFLLLVVFCQLWLFFFEKEKILKKINAFKTFLQKYLKFKKNWFLTGARTSEPHCYQEHTWGNLPEAELKQTEAPGLISFGIASHFFDTWMCIANTFRHRSTCFGIVWCSCSICECCFDVWNRLSTLQKTQHELRYIWGLPHFDVLTMIGSSPNTNKAQWFIRLHYLHYSTYASLAQFDLTLIYLKCVPDSVELPILLIIKSSKMWIPLLPLTRYC